jgi:glucose/arabinose dehydrogenase
MFGFLRGYGQGQRRALLRLPYQLPLRVTAIFIVLALIVAFLDSSQSYAATRWPQIQLKLVANDFQDPIDVVSPKDGTDRLFVIERGGVIYIIENGEQLATPFLDLSDRVSNIADCSECGLLGLAFPPDFAEKGYFFVDYTSATDLIGPDDDDPDPKTIGDTVIARFHVTSNPNVANADNEERILMINQPDVNHNGGHIVFGPDDRLYIGMGDGGGGGDPYRNGQDRHSLLGKILRIQVGENGPYTVPDDNPFVGNANFRPEIWAWGLRNPWRYNFDPITGDLYVADVGQNLTEEVNHVKANLGQGGMNFGWPITEGDQCFPPEEAQDCSRYGLTGPVAVYTHDVGGCSITGGYVFRSQRPFQSASYLYGDFCTGKVFGLQMDGNQYQHVELRDLPISITSFGEDGDGNIYLVSYSGEIYQIVDSNNITYLPGLSTNP